MTHWPPKRPTRSRLSSFSLLPIHRFLTAAFRDLPLQCTQSFALHLCVFAQCLQQGRQTNEIVTGCLFGPPLLFHTLIMPPKRSARSTSSRSARKPTATLAKIRAPSLQEVYARCCAEVGLRPNSAVLSLLPDKGGVEYSGATLDLSRNYVGDKGVAPILATLQRMPTVRTLILSENGLRNHGVELLCASAAQLTQLEFIDVSDNFISEGAAVALEKLLTENRHIKDIAFENTKIPVEWRVRLLNALEANKSAPTPTPSVPVS